MTKRRPLTLLPTKSNYWNENVQVQLHICIAPQSYLWCQLDTISQVTSRLKLTSWKNLFHLIVALFTSHNKSFIFFTLLGALSSLGHFGQFFFGLILLIKMTCQIRTKLRNKKKVDYVSNKELLKAPKRGSAKRA